MERDITATSMGWQWGNNKSLNDFNDILDDFNKRSISFGANSMGIQWEVSEICDNYNKNEGEMGRIEAMERRMQWDYEDYNET